MNLVWYDYNPKTMTFVESWLDESAVESTGLDEGFCAFYEYWAKEDGFDIGENYWCKVVFENGQPFAVVALCRDGDKVLIMELVVAPEKRGRGRGTELLKALLTGNDILGFIIHSCEAVIFPGNTASQKAFENAGFRHHRTHKDGSAFCYRYESKSRQSE